MTRRAAAGLGILALAGGAIAVAAPDAPAGCKLDEGSTSLLRVYECQEKLRIASEAATRVAAIERNGQLIGLRVEGGAVLVDTQGRREGFRIVTAEAVTEVRTAKVAVEATAGTTSVFVEDGGVSVSRDGKTVSLRAGQGVDVGATRAAAPSPPPLNAPAPSAARPAPPVSRAPSPRGGLEVKTWGAQRAGALMARLGQS